MGGTGVNKVKDVFVVGFALFAMFFGAGNLIFPPFLGLESGSHWSIAFLGFFIADALFALIGVISLIKYNGNAREFLSRCGKRLGVVLGCVIIICIGPLVAVPRTSAVTYEVGILPNFGHSVNPIVFSIIFFVITLLLSIRPTKVVDIVGQYLTPVLLICLLVIIIKGVIFPIGSIRPESLINQNFQEGIKQGYQTMDAMAAIIFSAVVILAIVGKGYKEEKIKIKMTISAGVVAVVGLLIVYGGLSYLGATVSGSGKYGIDVDTTTLIVAIIKLVLGKVGLIVLGIVVALACLTTSIGLVSACGQYFSELTKNKWKYEYVVIVVCVVSAIISNFGVNTIINFAGPILNVVYPAAFTMIVLSLFTRKIKNDNVFKLAVYVALIVSFLTELTNHNIKIPIVNSLPLHSVGFNWVVPVVIFAIVGYFIPSRRAEKMTEIK